MAFVWKPATSSAEAGAGAELRSLTSLRGLAAMAVVMQHFSATAQVHSRVPIPSLVPHGYVAVDFFFVLSGFIMAYTYLGSFQALGMRAFGPFLAKRVARVVPLNLAVLALIMLAGGWSLLVLDRNIFFETNHPVFDLAANALMVHGLGIGRNLNGPSWSISAEFAAYLLFPLFVAVMCGSRALAGAGAAAAVAGLCWLALQGSRLGLEFDGPPLSLVRCFAEFALGMAAFRLFGQPWATGLLGRDSVTVGLSLAAAASLAAGYDLPAVLLFPFIVVAYAVNGGFAARAVQARLFHFLGVVSFSLYLLHELFRPLGLHLFRWLQPDPVGAGAALAFALIASCSVIPFAWLAYVAVERPGRALIRAALNGRACPADGGVVQVQPAPIS